MLNQTDYARQQRCDRCIIQTASLPSYHQPHSIMVNSLRSPQRFHHWLQFETTKIEHIAAELIDRIRPASLRSFDQIPMYPCDHARQTALIAPYLEGQSVAFIGDSDGTSLLLGILRRSGMPGPSRMLLLDFDERLLQVAQQVADEYGFDTILETRLYNVFDSLPSDLVEQFDWFYTNPPYGSHNQGKSGQLFITRGCEIVRSGGHGCIILPHDKARMWTRTSMHATQRLLCEHGWTVSEKINHMHRYRLDDDRYLTSALMLIEHSVGMNVQLMPYAGRQVLFDEIPRFYGRNVLPPYPRYIRNNGIFDFSWSVDEVTYHV